MFRSCRKALALLALASTPSAALAAEQVVLYGDDDYAPYSYVEGGKFKGMYVDILQRAAQKLAPDYQVELQPRPWTRALAELEKGVSFALFPPGLKSERPYIEPYSVPLYRETVVLFCNEKIMSAPHGRFPEDFTGVKIGVNAGFLLSGRLMDAVHAGAVAIEPAKGNETNLRKLAAGRIACYASDRLAALYSANKLGAGLGNGKFVLRETVELSGENTYIAYSMHNNPSYKPDFVRKMNDVLQAMKRSGEIKRIEQAYLHA